MIIILRLLGLFILIGGVTGMSYKLLCTIKGILDMDEDLRPALILFVIFLLSGIGLCILGGTFLMFVKIT